MIALVLTIALIGFVAYLVTLIPLPPPFPQIIIGVLVIFAILIVLQALGVSTGMPHVGWR